MAEYCHRLMLPLLTSRAAFFSRRRSHHLGAFMRPKMRWGSCCRQGVFAAPRGGFAARSSRSLRRRDQIESPRAWKGVAVGPCCDCGMCALADFDRCVEHRLQIKVADSLVLHAQLINNEDPDRLGTSRRVMAVRTNEQL